jgi:hypothetical protein
MVGRLAFWHNHRGFHDGLLDLAHSDARVRDFWELGWVAYNLFPPILVDNYGQSQLVA